MKKWEKDAIKEILENFDFEQCRKTMLKMGWTWGFKETPSVQELFDTAQDLLEEACKEDFRSSSTGGFWVFRNKKRKELFLIFACEEWWTEKY